MRECHRLRPDYAEAFYNKGIALADLDLLEDAMASYDKAISLKPDYGSVYNARGNALCLLKRLSGALLNYDRAISVWPGYAEARSNLGLLHLTMGNLRAGWTYREFRWAKSELASKRPPVDARPWQGECLQSRSILVYGEQGLGDTIQFVRYIPMLQRAGARVSLIVPTRLHRLVRPSVSGVDLRSYVRRAERFDFHCPLMSLPLWFQTDVSTIPASIPYIHAELALSTRWRQKIGGQGYKVGICWQGNPTGAIDRGRSVPLAAFDRLTNIPGVRLISLQKEHGLDQLERLPADMKVETLGPAFDGGRDAFVDTAAVMETLDLAVTTDTAVAHLAGALGRPVWVALKYVPDWRWMLDREDSPWYPTMRLFRQEKRAEWKEVFARIGLEIARLGGSDTPTVEQAAEGLHARPSDVGAGDD